MVVSTQCEEGEICGFAYSIAYGRFEGESNETDFYMGCFPKPPPNWQEEIEEDLDYPDMDYILTRDDQLEVDDCFKWNSLGPDDSHDSYNAILEKCGYDMACWRGSDPLKVYGWRMQCICTTDNCINWNNE